MNFAHRTHCNRCQTPRPAGATTQGGEMFGAGGGYGQSNVVHEEVARDFVQLFAHDPNPVNAAIQYLQLNAHNPAFFTPRSS